MHAIQAIHSHRKGLVHSLCLRPRIYVFQKRILLVFIKIKGLVKHPINICNAVVCLYFEGLWELVASSKQGRQICSFQI